MKSGSEYKNKILSKQNNSAKYLDYLKETFLRLKLAMEIIIWIFIGMNLLTQIENHRNLSMLKLKGKDFLGREKVGFGNCRETIKLS